MVMSAQERDELITKFQKHPTDRGSVEVQIALLTR
ncbi:MAG: 30S ribosomal protein S15, partial [Actinobacteria bacterium]|nr:30S ribosomal protein S15 [Actinomycetota bacterium]NIV89805.1 30S ribosomal protein S15 [Actinomycetota bacterium]NIX24213.1 30S ribosomal protein S15 [Actinomycetota bacterium]